MSKNIFVKLILANTFKLVHNTPQTARNKNNLFNVRTAQHWFKNYHRGNFDFQDKGSCGRPFVDDDDQLKAIREIVPIKQFEKLRMNSTFTIPESFDTSSKLKKLVPWRILHELNDN